MTGTKYTQDFSGPTWQDVHTFIDDLEREHGLKVHITLDPQKSAKTGATHGFWVRAEARRRLAEKGEVFCGAWRLQCKTGEKTAPGAVWWALYDIWEQVEAQEAEKENLSRSE